MEELWLTDNRNHLIFNWDLAMGLGLQEEGLLLECKVYEHAIAVSDVALGWIYGLSGVGLVLGTRWDLKLA